MLSNIWKAYDLNSWQNNFINGIQIHNQNSWFETTAIYFSLAISKPNSHWQHQSPILIGNINIKAQFLLATLKPNFHWQNQSSILIGNIKAQFFINYFIKKKRAQDYQRLAKKKYHATVARKAHCKYLWRNPKKKNVY